MVVIRMRWVSVALIGLINIVAVRCFVVTQDGVVGKAAILTGPAHVGVPAACFQRVDPGPCGNDVVRVYYDHKTYTCKAFSYSGCGGNMNRFVSVKNCYKLCHPYYRQRPAETVEAGTADPSATPLPTTAAVTDKEPTAELQQSTTPGTTPAVPEIEFIHYISETQQAQQPQSPCGGGVRGPCGGLVGQGAIHGVRYVPGGPIMTGGLIQPVPPPMGSIMMPGSQQFIYGTATNDQLHFGQGIQQHMSVGSALQPQYNPAAQYSFDVPLNQLTGKRKK